jgi:hypothetical protein
VSVGAQIEKFYQEVSDNQYLWFAEFPDGTILEFDVKDDRVSFPLWSSKSRINRLKKLSPELLNDVKPVGLSWVDFKQHIVPIIEEKERLVNLNLSGKNLTGIDLELESLIRNMEALISAS